MKKRWLLPLVSLAVAVLCLLLVGCMEANDQSAEEVTYTILYSDGIRINNIVVKSGDVYSLTVPSPRVGYEFVGYFDAESGGTQYTGASGIALTPFRDTYNITLFPHFEPKIYTIRLRSDEASFDTTSAFSVKTGETMPTLPGDAYLTYGEGNAFLGWYDAFGKKVTDSTGMSDRLVDSDLVASADSEDVIWLHACLKARQVTVWCYSDDGAELLATSVVDYGTFASDLAVVTVDMGYVAAWSVDIGGTVYINPITSDISLYAVRYERVVYDGVLRTGTDKIAGSGRYVKDTFDLPITKEDLTDQGYNCLVFTFYIDLKEQDNCYQYITVKGEGGVVIGTERLSHGGSACDHTWKTYVLTYEIGIDALTSETIEFQCQAENKIFKDFYIGTVRVVVRATVATGKK